MPFQDQSGNLALPRLTPDGAVPVADQGGDSAGSPAASLGRLVWEICELRRVYCEETGQFFHEYPGE